MYISILNKISQHKCNLQTYHIKNDKIDMLQPPICILSIHNQPYSFKQKRLIQNVNKSLKTIFIQKDTLFPIHIQIRDNRFNYNAVSQLLLISSKCIIYNQNSQFNPQKLCL